jgi:thioredoxin-like negative regulator of GroEL
MTGRQRRRVAEWFALGLTFFSGAQHQGAIQPRRTEAASARSEAKKATPQVLPFVENDYATARSQAKKQGKLLFVDAWADWCHTCLSMKNFVLTDPLLTPFGSELVYLAIDTEQPTNQAFLQRFPITSLPTILVLDAQEQVVARFTGAMTAKELSVRLHELLSQQQAQRPKLSEADALATQGDGKAAAQRYEEALMEPGARPRALLGLIQALATTGQTERCIEVYEQHAQQVGKSALATDFASYAASCLESLGDADRRQKLRRRLRTDVEQLLADPAAELSVDDRSDAYGTLIELSDALGEKSVGDALAEKRLHMLEQAAQAAPNPIKAATFDAHRFDCYRRLGRWKPAEEMLLSSEQRMPKDYNPSARLARLYYETGRIEEARERIDRALSLSHGPRRVGMYELRASILGSQSRTREAMESLSTAITIYKASRPASQSGATARLRSLQKQLDALTEKLLQQPEPVEQTEPKSVEQPRGSQPGKVKQKKPPQPKKPEPSYEPGTPVADKKKSRQLANRDSQLK